MYRRPNVPRGAFAVMSQHRQEALLRKQTKELTATRTVSEFLENKIRDYRMDLDYIDCAHNGLLEVLDNERITPPGFVKALKPFMTSARRITGHLNYLEDQRKAIQDDIEDLPPVKRQRQGELDVEFLERAYTEIIYPKVMSASAKLPKQMHEHGRTFNASNFKRDVAQYYDIPKDMGYCHLTGFWDATEVKAAHLVPKSLHSDEIAYLFGVRAMVSSDPRNALSLHRTLEAALDSGKIVILPILEDILEDKDVTPSRWKCVLTDETIRHHTWVTFAGSEKRFDDVDQTELKFLGDARPAKRFLYFRFVITYIHCKRQGNLGFTDKVENIRLFWPTPGEYLCKSMLNTLSRSISGHKLPESLLQDRTFEGEQSISGQPTSGLVLAKQIYDAMIASIKDHPNDEDEDVFEDSIEYL
ncbi:unnamed protein product [Penicillium salamii]|nr:unnamed protein product [Penicillium salamii]